MRERTAEEFTRDPVGGFVIGQTWLYFCPNEHLSGYLLWGSPAPADFNAIVPLMACTHGPPMKPHASLIDVTLLDGLPAATFERAVRFSSLAIDTMRSTITRMALVRSVGLGSAIAAGFFSIVAPFAPFAFFDNTEKALEWLQRDRDLVHLEEVYRRRSAILGVAPTIGDLRTLLDATPDISLLDAAKILGLSSRTLQRRLGEAGTSLRREATRARVRKAEKLLIDTDVSITRIAFEVGCASAQHFSSMFRSVHDETPSAWRSRRRATDGLE